MKRIKDERLILKNLSNIRWAFLVENLAAISILVVQAVQKRSLYAVVTYNNPVFLVLMIGALSLTFLSVNVSAQVEDHPKVTGQRLSLYFLLEWIFWGLFFFLIMSFRYPLTAIISGLIPALAMTGVSLYANKFKTN
ncbi:hypothetical protein [Lentilactobacillus otakiensis]|uniref:hypothetical protein n=1 Tax=Lentilactobacillus otakiensis TaxID=481720 RepID=UPI003D17A988